ncbi:ATP-binding cassette domain-containing protein [Rhodococcus coprophilus]|uniref:ABC transporter ATP-binding protein n=1 Tax=Rhodococcus coprophilus TaxID=38310 RepID=A0A2X4UB61_9NOCA|nr:ABC transporter ATP-binding protein [Rhodococcus coprophilus]MBM7459677.1 ABC-2 type transport system ATP-binding protein [Rhodococcus coprophilus]SQI37016.1 ABC transporter ATP-binding protein [Rhodococcus coprophilus]
MPIVEVRGLYKRYGDRTAVDGVSFDVREGEIFGILGSNGAGKTTTAECVSGLRRPDEGTVRVAGLDPIADRVALTELLGAQLQQSELQPKMTVREALELYASFYPHPVDGIALAERLGLGHALGTRFAKLSGGQQQRLFIALALIGAPRVVVLDELTTGLDPRGRRETWELIEEIRASGVTVLLVTHFMEEAQRLCDRVAIFDSGRIEALGTPTELIDRTSTAVVVSFRPSASLDPEALSALPGVLAVRRDHDRLVVEGNDESVEAVLALLAREGISPRRLRITEATLDDAFLDITASEKLT